MTLEDIKRNYTHIGTANSTGFKRPAGEWVRVYVNWNGNYEIHACHATMEWYDVFSD